MARMSTTAAWAAALVLFLPALAAHAADDPAQLAGAKALATEIAASRKAKDAKAVAAQAKKAAAVHNGIEDKGLRGKLQKELGAALKSKHLADAHDPILVAFADFDDGKGVYKQIKKFMPGPKTEEASEREKGVLRALDKLAPDSALKELFDLAEKAKDYDAGALAINALGSYKDSKKRIIVLETLIKLLARFEPPRGQVAGEATKKRWGALAAPLIDACNELTGQKIRDPAEWHDLWKANRKKPGDIFVGA